MNVQDAIERPVRTVLSGPTAGIIGARQYRGTSDAGLISMDIGGTSTDVCFLADERIPLTDDKRIGRYSIAQPVADIHTIGAGGGSIVSVDRGGHLRVGPESAGADPGPACYGRGGPATVTDALVELGRIPTDRPISSELDLSSELAQKSLLERGKRLDRSPQAVAEGTMDIVLTRLSEAIRSVTVEKGHKPSNYSLVAFGGGGGLYAAQLAGRLDIETVVVPRQAGVGSARGLLNAPTCHQATISPLEMLETESGELPGIGELNARRPDWTADDVQFEAECQYEGQTHPVTVSVSENTTCDELISAFHTRYSEIFNYRPDTERVELVHLNAFWFKRPPAMEVRPPDITDSDSSRLGTTSVYLDGQSREMPMFQLEAVNETVDGPALLSGETTTVLVPNDWTMHPQPHSVRMVLERG